MDLLVVLASVIVFATVIVHLRIVDIDSQPGSIIINFLTLSGIYAVWTTKFYSIFTVALLLIFTWAIYENKLKVSFNLSQIKTTIGITAVNIVIFVALFFRTGRLLIPHDDYLFYARVAVSNKKWAVENTGTFYNWLSDSYPRNEVYHYLELWTASLGKTLNGQSINLNLFFFAYLLAAVIAGIFLLEFIDKYNPKITRTKAIALLLVFYIPGLMFFSHPWDTITQNLLHAKVAISGMNGIWMGLKKWYIIIPVVTLLLYAKEKAFDKCVIMTISGFIYLPLMPIIVISMTIWYMVQMLKGDLGYIRNMVFVLITGTLIGLFYTVIGKSGSVAVGTTILDWLYMDHWTNRAPAIILKVIIAPVISLLPILLIVLITKAARFRIYPTKIAPYIIIYFVCILFWMMFSMNIDANQSFLLVFGAMIPIIIILGLTKIFMAEYKIATLILVAIYYCPGILSAMTSQDNNMTLTPDERIQLKKYTNDRILYIPDNDELNSVYAYNERVYTGANSLQVYSDDLELASVASSIYCDTSNMNEIELYMYRHYRDMSPYYKKCGVYKVEDSCLLEFTRERKIQIICAISDNVIPDNCRMMGRIKDYKFFKIQYGKF